MPAISALLKKKIAAEGLSLAQAAKKIGISVPSVRAGVAGKSVPNARSIPKYASFLGLSLAEAQKLAGDRKGKGGRKAKAKAGRPGKARRGRPPGSGKRRGRPPGSGKRRGRPPGRAKAGRPPGRRGRPPSPGPSKALAAAIVRAFGAVRRSEK